MCKSVFKATTSRMQVIIAGFCIAGDLAAAVLAGSSQTSRLNPQEKS